MPAPSAPPLPPDPTTVTSDDGAVTVTAHPEASFVTVEVDMSGLIGTTGPYVTTVYRTTPDGTTVIVAGLDRIVAPHGIAVGVDNQAPLGVALTYRAKTIQPGPDITSDTATITLPASTIGTWCNSLTDPSRSIRLIVIDYPSWTRPARVNLLEVAERTNPLPVGRGRGGESGTLTVFTDTPQRQAKVDALIDSDDTWLIQSPAAHGEPDRYVTVGDSTRQRVVRVGGQPERTFPLPLVVVDRPLTYGVELTEPGFSYAADTGSGTDGGTWDDLPDDRRYIDG